jgi:hypothetical protein
MSHLKKPMPGCAYETICRSAAQAFSRNNYIRATITRLMGVIPNPYRVDLRRLAEAPNREVNFRPRTEIGEPKAQAAGGLANVENIPGNPPRKPTAELATGGSPTSPARRKPVFRSRDALQQGTQGTDTSTAPRLALWGEARFYPSRADGAYLSGGLKTTQILAIWRTVSSHCSRITVESWEEWSVRHSWPIARIRPEAGC